VAIAGPDSSDASEKSGIMPQHGLRNVAGEDCSNTRWKRFLLGLGAHALRCEYCRFNFVSFRKRKERFGFHGWRKLKRDKASAAKAK
jgi:hypothetical protein